MQTLRCWAVEELSRSAVQSAAKVSPAVPPHTNCKPSKLADCRSCLSIEMQLATYKCSWHHAALSATS